MKKSKTVEMSESLKNFLSNSTKSLNTPRHEHEFIEIWTGESTIWSSLFKRYKTEKLERCKECGLIRRTITNTGGVVMSSSKRLMKIYDEEDSVFLIGVNESTDKYESAVANYTLPEG